MKRIYALLLIFIPVSSYGMLAKKALRLTYTVNAQQTLRTVHWASENNAHIKLMRSMSSGSNNSGGESESLKEKIAQMGDFKKASDTIDAVLKKGGIKSYDDFKAVRKALSRLEELNYHDMTGRKMVSFYWNSPDGYKAILSQLDSQES